MQSVECPAVRDKCGKHLDENISDRNTILEETKTKAEGTGILRLENKFYRYNTKKISTEVFMTENKDTRRNFFSSNPVFNSNIKNQNFFFASKYPKNFASKSENISDTPLSQISLFGETNTFCIKGTNPMNFSNASTHFCSSNPNVFIITETDSKNSEVNLQQGS